MENVKPRVLKVKGSSLKEAFQNINKDELGLLNKALENDYKAKYIETKGFRNNLYAKRLEIEKELTKKSLLIESFWTDYYRSLAKRNK